MEPFAGWAALEKKQLHFITMVVTRMLKIGMPTHDETILVKLMGKFVL
jgi:hypothetical protein